MDEKTKAEQEAQKKKEIAEEKRRAKLTALIAKISISAVMLVVIFVYRYNKYKFKWEEIVIFALAVIPWFSSFMETFKIGKDGVDVKFLQEKVEKLETKVVNEVQPLAQEAKDIATANEASASSANEIAKTAMTTTLYGIGKNPVVETETAISAVDGGKTSGAEKNVLNPEDPQKGRWGGKRVDEEKGRKITVNVNKIKGEDYLRRLNVRVESTDPVNKPLSGKVTFHLHDTFARPDFDVEVNSGVAETNLVAWGAFTIGAEADDGKTRLEYDISEDGKNSDDEFYRR